MNEYNGKKVKVYGMVKLPDGSERIINECNQVYQRF